MFFDSAFCDVVLIALASPVCEVNAGCVSVFYLFFFFWAHVAADDIIELTRVIWYSGCISPAGDIVVDIIVLFSIF